MYVYQTSRSVECLLRRRIHYFTFSAKILTAAAAPYTKPRKRSESQTFIRSVNR